MFASTEGNTPDVCFHALVKAGPSALVYQLKERGYQAHLINVNVHPDIAFSRMVNRFTKTGRLIDPDFFRSIGNRPRDTYVSLKGDDRFASHAEIDANTRDFQTAGTGHAADVVRDAKPPAPGAGLRSGRSDEPGNDPLAREVARSPSGEGSGGVNEPRSGGAAAVASPQAQDLTIAGRAARALADNPGGRLVSPLIRGLTSPSAVVRDVTSRLVENPVYLTMNARGAASAQAAETLVKQYNGKLGLAIDKEKSIWNAYRKAGGELKREQFQEEVGKAMRLDDQHPIPDVAQAAQNYPSWGRT